MAISAFKGPVVSFGAQPNSDGNEFQGPDVHNQSAILQDPRAYTHYAGGNWVAGWLFSGSGLMTIDAVPAAVNTTCVAASQSTVANVALASASNATANLVVGVSYTNINTGAIVTGAVAIECPNATATNPFVPYGSQSVAGQSGVNVWGPDRCLGRVITVTTGGTDSGKTLTISGADCYGVPITQTLSLANTSAVSTTKAFKYINSAVASTAVATTITLGVGTVFGLPIRADNLNYVDILHNTSSATAITAAVTSTATALTGDVRGTFIAAVTGTSQLTAYQATPFGALTSAAGLIGVAQA